MDGQSGELSVFIENLIRPNGIALNKNEDRLYVVNSSMGDEGKSAVHVYDIEDDKVIGGTTFIDNFAPGTTDGIRYMG